jgi:hypothetical protein
MRGGAICADPNTVQKIKERRETIFRNLSIATPTSYLGWRAKMNAVRLGHWNGYGDLCGSRAFCATGVYSGDYVKILLAGNGCGIGKKQR